MRKLKLDEIAIREILDELDAQDQLKTVETDPPSTRYTYRVPALTVNVHTSPNTTVPYLVPTRSISRGGVSFLISNLVQVGDPCTLHLITIRNNWQTVTGRLVSCRYIQGSAHVHEARVEFDQPIDPASFAPTAVRARILIADDSPMARRLLEHQLSVLNVEVASVNDGIDAVKLAEQEAFDLILMDIEMPELDGLAAVRILRSKGYVRPIIGMSSLEADEVRDDCLRAGCDDFLPKPTRSEELAAAVNHNKPEPLVSALLHQPEMLPLIDAFVETLPGQIKVIEAAYASEDLLAVAVEVRKLKGEAAGFGFEPITAVAKDTETAIKRGLPLVEVRRRLSQLLRLCLAARPATCHDPGIPNVADGADADSPAVEPEDAYPRNECLEKPEQAA